MNVLLTFWKHSKMDNALLENSLIDATILIFSSAFYEVHEIFKPAWMIWTVRLHAEKRK